MSSVVCVCGGGSMCRAVTVDSLGVGRQKMPVRCAAVSDMTVLGCRAKGGNPKCHPAMSLCVGRCLS